MKINWKMLLLGVLIAVLIRFAFVIISHGIGFCTDSSVEGDIPGLNCIASYEGDFTLSLSIDLMGGIFFPVIGFLIGILFYTKRKRFPVVDFIIILLIFGILGAIMSDIISQLYYNVYLGMPGFTYEDPEIPTGYLILAEIIIMIVWWTHNIISALIAGAITYLISKP